jgi:hypothetical protein
MGDVTETLLDRPTIVNWSLAELGLPPRFSIDDATNLGAIVQIFWPRALVHCFSLYEWTFCRKTFLLARQAETPVTGYAYGFSLPGGILGEPFKYLSDPRCERPVRDVRIEARTVFSDEPALYAVCKVEVDPQYWDLAFTNAFAVALAAYLAIPLTQDPDMAAEKQKIAFGSAAELGAGGLFGRLIAQNRSAHPVASPMETNVLGGGRFSGPWYGNQ